jgi:hypothetical protein
LSDITLIAPEVLMRLPCQKAFILLALTTIACQDPVWPPRVTARFALNDINGRALPTYVAPTPGFSPTIVWGTLILYSSGKAVMTEYRREFDTETTYTRNYKYRVTDNQIEFDYSPPCPPNALCPILPKGTITPNGLTLEFGQFDSQAILYNYRITATL